MEQKIQIRYRKPKFPFVLALFLILATMAGTFVYLKLTETPADSLAFNAWTDSAPWTFALSDGSPAIPDEQGLFQLPQGATLYCTLTLPEDLTSSALVQLSSPRCNTALLIDGAVVFDPSRLFDPQTGFPVPAQKEAPSSGLASLTSAAGKTLTVAVQFLGDSTDLKSLPRLTLFDQLNAYDSQALAAGAAAARPAGMFLVLAVFLFGLFLIRLWSEESDWSLLLLSISALTFCLDSTVPYALYTALTLQTPIFIWLTDLLPALPLLWLLWLHTSGRARAYGWLLPLGCSGLCAAAVVLALAGHPLPALTRLLTGQLLPLAALLALLWGGWEALRRRNGWYIRFFLLGGLILGISLPLSLLPYCNWCEKVATDLRASLGWGSIFPLLTATSYLEIFTCSLLAIWDFICGVVRQGTELQALSLQNRYAQEHIASLRQSLEETRILRHDMRHHIESLSGLCQAGDLGRVQDYFAHLTQQVHAIPVCYSDNILVNAILTPRLQQARQAGIRVKTDILVPEHLGIQDADLAIFLTNLLDNAIQAASVSDAGSRFLSLQMAVKGGRLLIACENSYTTPLRQLENGRLASTKSEPGHGYGLSIMRRVAEQYDSLLLVEHSGGVFRVQTSLSQRQPA